VRKLAPVAARKAMAAMTAGLYRRVFRLVMSTSGGWW
jgi:hypothetical protein